MPKYIVLKCYDLILIRFFRVEYLNTHSKRQRNCINVDDGTFIENYELIKKYG